MDIFSEKRSPFIRKQLILWKKHCFSNLKKECVVKEYLKICERYGRYRDSTPLPMSYVIAVPAHLCNMQATNASAGKFGRKIEKLSSPSGVSERVVGVEQHLKLDGIRLGFIFWVPTSSCVKIGGNDSICFINTLDDHTPCWPAPYCNHISSPKVCSAHILPIFRVGNVTFCGDVVCVNNILSTFDDWKNHFWTRIQQSTWNWKKWQYVEINHDIAPLLWTDKTMPRDLHF